MILVTGGCGFIGSHVAAELLSLNAEVIIIDNLSNSSKKIITKLRKLTSKKIVFSKGDLKNKIFLEKIFSKYNISDVFHFAGLKSIKQSISNPLLYFSNNVEGTKNLIEVMRKKNVRNIIFSSSATVYNLNNSIPWSEKSLVSNNNHPYGNSKLLIENMLRDLSEKEDNWNVAILRYFNPVGSHQSNILGEHSIINSTNLVPKICKTILGISKSVPIYGNNFNTPDGTGIRDYIHISDLVSGHIKAYNYIKNKNGCFIWNLGSGKGYSVLEVIKKFSEILNIDINYKFEPRRPGDLDEYWASIEKSKNELNWSPVKDLNDIVNDTYKFINKCKNDLF